MADWLDYLSGIGKAFLGNTGSSQQPAATQSAAPASTGSSDQSTDVLSKFPMPKSSLLDSPYLQGALAAYFGAVSSPRQQGWGGAIGHGGLAGLKAYSEAEKSELQPYLDYAKIQEQATQTGKDVAQTKEANVRAEGIANIGPANKATADQLSLVAAQPNVPDNVRQSLQAEANSIRQNTSRIVDVSEALKSAWAGAGDTLRDERLQQEIDQAAAKGPVELAELKQRLINAQQTAGLNSERYQLIGDQITDVQNRIDTFRQYGSDTPPPEEQVTDDTGTTVERIVPGTHFPPEVTIGKPSTTARDDGAKAIKEAGEAFDQQAGKPGKPWPWQDESSAQKAKKNYIQAVLKKQGRDPATGELLHKPGGGGPKVSTGGLPPKPPGWKAWVKMPDGTLGYRDASGNDRAVPTS
ncbi:MAG TPA: hypothetical protein VKD24_07135 [Candidatus Angelobacter sp.]|nr:hypothetical protein [Candidatus Angelobacter sp.]